MCLATAWTYVYKPVQMGTMKGIVQEKGKYGPFEVKGQLLGYRSASSARDVVAPAANELFEGAKH